MLQLCDLIFFIINTASVKVAKLSSGLKFKTKLLSNEQRENEANFKIRTYENRN